MTWHEVPGKWRTGKAIQPRYQDYGGGCQITAGALCWLFTANSQKEVVQKNLHSCGAKHKKTKFRNISKARANSTKLRAFSVLATPKYLKIDLTVRSFYQSYFLVGLCHICICKIIALICWNHVKYNWFDF